MSVKTMLTSMAVEKHEGMLVSLVKKSTKISGRVSQFVLQMRHDGNSSMLIQPARLNVDMTISESKADDCKTLAVDGYIEPLTVLVGLRDIDFVKGYLSLLQDAIPRLPRLNSVGPTSRPVVYAVNRLQLHGKLDPLRVSLVDDTEERPIHLFRVELTQASATVSTCKLEPEDPNKRLALEHSESFKASAGLALEATFYNWTVSEYEPLMENWTLEAEACELAPTYGKSLSIKATKMLNINMSYERTYLLLSCSGLCGRLLAAEAKTARPRLAN
jgi:hypothetical protein